MPELSWTLVRNTVGHFHPALVHFPVALVLAGLGFELWGTLRGRGASGTARLLLVFGLLGALAAALTGLSLFHPEDFQGPTLAVITIHRALGLASAAALVLAGAANGIPGRGELGGGRLALYRGAYAVSGLLVGLTGHYGGWVVFGWGSVWTF
jgi:uncharacterized membrane protein